MGSWRPAWRASLGWREPGSPMSCELPGAHREPPPPKRGRPSGSSDVWVSLPILPAPFLQGLQEAARRQGLCPTSLQLEISPEGPQTPPSRPPACRGEEEEEERDPSQPRLCFLTLASEPWGPSTPQSRDARAHPRGTDSMTLPSSSLSCTHPLTRGLCVCMRVCTCMRVCCRAPSCSPVPAVSGRHAGEQPRSLKWASPGFLGRASHSICPAFKCGRGVAAPVNG